MDHLLVNSIKAWGAADAWNRQCEDTAWTIREWDHILAINGKCTVEGLRAESRSALLLRLTIARNVRLRADAVEFAPAPHPQPHRKFQ